MGTKEELKKNLENIGPVIQTWVGKIPFMQQSVLMAAVRGPDTIHKDHISKQLNRFLRRSFLYSAFESAKAGRPTTMWLPHMPGGGSFTGPCSRIYISWGGDQNLVPEDMPADVSLAMKHICNEYLLAVDEIPHHFHLHLMHASEILGYKHPDNHVRNFWCSFYYRLVNDSHLYPESEKLMDERLSDVELYWRQREEVVAK